MENRKIYSISVEGAHPTMITSAQTEIESIHKRYDGWFVVEHVDGFTSVVNPIYVSVVEYYEEEA